MNGFKMWVSVFVRMSTSTDFFQFPLSHLQVRTMQVWGLRRLHRCPQRAYPQITMASLSTDTVGAFKPDRTSAICKRLVISPIKALYKYYTPQNINLAGGIPLESCFPFKSVQVNLDIPVDTTEEDCFTVTKGVDLHLNYHASDGVPELKNWVYDHITKIHHPPHAYNVAVTIGATDGWFQVINLLKSQCILFDEYVYGASMTPCNTLGRTPIGVKSDENGIIPDELRKTVLAARARGLEVEVLYLIPVGHNPMGVTIPFWRKQEIYKVCQELDLLIVEDGELFFCV